MYLERLDPAEINPLHLINRSDELAWLATKVGIFLRRPHKQRGASFAIMGAKGVGKSIFTRAALSRLRGEREGRDALFLQVDCRRLRSVSEVYRRLSTEIVDELEGARKERRPIPPEALDAARIVSELARFDQGELKTAHERVLRFKAAARWAPELPGVLKSTLGVDIEREDKDIKTLTGSVRIDEERVQRMLLVLLRDLAARDLNVVLYLDNIDELDHEYKTQDSVSHVRQEVEALLGFHDAPVALILNLRTYMSGVLSREISEKRALDPLPEAELVQIVHRRLDQEPDEIQRASRGKEAQQGMRWLAQRSPTPLAFLMWYKALFERGALGEGGRVSAIRAHLRSDYASLRLDTLLQVIGAFPSPDAVVSREDLLAACKQETLLAQLQDLQVVLPVDFWNPREFTLEPVLQVIADPVLLTALSAR